MFLDGSGCFEVRVPIGFDSLRTVERRVEELQQMIYDLSISGLRGIDDGRLADLTPLVVLTGPNGCGKSTVLDALVIAAGNDPGDDVGRVVQRRPDLWNGARWLLSRQMEDGTTTISVVRKRGGQEETRSTRLAWSDQIDEDLVQDLSNQRPHVAISGSIDVDVESQGQAAAAVVGFLADNSYQCKLSQERVPRWETRLVDIPHGSNEPLHALYSAAAERGRKDHAVVVLRAVLGQKIRDITVLTDKAMPVVHLVHDQGSIPIAAAGEGVACLVRLAFELATAPSGLVLVEEPETHQHPRMIAQTAQLIWATVDRGVQVILSTHSIELIQALQVHAPSWAQNDMSIYRLALEQGKLSYERLGIADVDAMRVDVDNALGLNAPPPFEE